MPISLGEIMKHTGAFLLVFLQPIIGHIGNSQGREGFVETLFGGFTMPLNEIDHIFFSDLSIAASMGQCVLGKGISVGTLLN